jgi:hypothetical protein
MSHLTIETIARLVEDPPTVDESAHLETCAPCRRELEDMRADVASLALLPSLEPPADQWVTIETRLAGEGLLRLRRSRLAWTTVAFRIAAAIILFVLGGASAAAWLGTRQPAPLADRGATVGNPDIVAETPAPARTPGARVANPALPRSAPSVEARAWLRSNPRLAAVLEGREPGDYDEAVGFYREAEALYLNALTRMAQLGGGTDYGDPYARLAALEAITSITRTALGQAPADPVLNGYHVTALAQRDATLRQIAARTTDSWF